ncbi:MAG: flagellar export protein FliJ [Spirochaetales bacterium]|nr:flagellar export protein FliJ [Spirochaetales bacterium]
MRFRFRLEKVLELRRWEEKQAELVLAAITGECFNLQRQITSIQEERLSALSRRRTQDSVTVLLSLEAYTQRLTKLVETIQVNLDQKLLEREAAQKKYLEAQTKRKVLDKVEEKRRLEFKKAEFQRETKRQDDLNTAAFVRKMKAREGSGG